MFLKWRGAEKRWKSVRASLPLAVRRVEYSIGRFLHNHKTLQKYTPTMVTMSLSH
eukprot:SAG31_NODE_46707_length_253_cov_0.675325_1_plen_54_part_10